MKDSLHEALLQITPLVRSNAFINPFVVSPLLVYVFNLLNKSISYLYCYSFIYRFIIISRYNLSMNSVISPYRNKCFE